MSIIVFFLISEKESYCGVYEGCFKWDIIKIKY